MTGKPTRLAAAALLTVLPLSALPLLALAQAASAPAGAASRPAEPPKPYSFFVTSAGLGKGADRGGLAGADAHCQKLAAAANGGGKTWRAYLSTQAADGQPAVHARDRIGNGPWFNTRGAVVARDLAHLHGDTLELARLGSNLTRNTVFTEKNEPIKGAGDRPNQHDILTGSQPDGRAFTDGADHTCKNYTSSAAEGSSQVGHFDRTGGGNSSCGCGQENLVSTGGAGLFYCFAID